MKRIVILLAVLGLLGVADVVAQGGEGFEEQQKLLPSDGEAHDWFGWSVALDYDTAIIGASRGGEAGQNSGAAYLFGRNAAGTWSDQLKLTVTDGTTGGRFGNAVALDGNTAIVGRPGDNELGTSSGSAYVFIRDASGTWTEQAKLTATNGEPYEELGYSVALDGNTAVLGACPPFFSTGTGAAYVFTRDAAGMWTQQAKLTAADGAAGDRFGYSVGLDGDTVIVGAVYDDALGLYSGSAYVFARGATGMWTQQAKLTASNGATSDRFGSSIALDGGTAFIGAPGHEYSWGSAYVFSRDGSGTWTEQAALSSQVRDDEEFGWSVALDDGTAIIGAWTQVPEATGSAYLFTRDAAGMWTELTKLTPPNTAYDALFGCSVALDNGTAIIGAPGDDRSDLWAGSAYVFAPTEPLSLQIQIDIKPNDFPNSVNPRSRGLIPVALLGSVTFDVADVDESTLAFGPAGAPIAHMNIHLEDANYDGIMDLVAHFRTQDTGIACGDESATLVGETIDGQAIQGSDSIQTAGCVGRMPARSTRDLERDSRIKEPVNIERRQ